MGPLPEACLSAYRHPAVPNMSKVRLVFQAVLVIRYSRSDSQGRSVERLIVVAIIAVATTQGPAAADICAGLDVLEAQVETMQQIASANSYSSLFMCVRLS